MRKIAILTGGTWTEVEVAKKSAKFFETYIGKEYDTYLLPQEIGKFLENYHHYELAIPVFHWAYGEDGKIFAFLDILGVPHTFSSYETHALCLNKYRTNILAAAVGLTVPQQYLYFGNHEIGVFPVIVKPNTGGSSFFTYKVSSENELKEKIQEIESHIDDDILVQEFIAGEEYSVPIVHGEVLPIMKLEKKADDFFDYESKYESEARIRETWPKIEENLEQRLKHAALKMYTTCKIQGFCRIDFLVKYDKVYFLEVNTIPGMTEASILPKSWKLTGRSFEELVQSLIVS